MLLLHSLSTRGRSATSPLAICVRNANRYPESERAWTSKSVHMRNISKSCDSSERKQISADVFQHVGIGLKQSCISRAREVSHTVTLAGFFSVFLNVDRTEVRFRFRKSSEATRIQLPASLLMCRSTFLLTYFPTFGKIGSHYGCPFSAWGPKEKWKRLFGD